MYVHTYVLHINPKMPSKYTLGNHIYIPIGCLEIRIILVRYCSFIFDISTDECSVIKKNDLSLITKIGYTIRRTSLLVAPPP